MPKGINKDGSKKVRPDNSGRKAKGGVKISPQISPEAALVLAARKKQKINLNEFISQAILKKSQNDGAKVVTTKEKATITLGQIDLVEMLKEIQLERSLKHESTFVS